MKKITEKIVLSILTFALMFSLQVVSANGISADELPANIMMQETNPKALLWGAENEGMQRHFLNKGALKANIYSVIYKDKYDYRYALAGDVQFGQWLLKSLAFESKTSYKGNSLEAVKNLVEDYIASNKDYSFVEPSKYTKDIYISTNKSNFEYDAKDKSYLGVIGTSFVRDNVVYRDIVRVKIYNSKFYGPSMRFLEIKQEDNLKLWPELKVLLKK